ncbi:MAG: RibD family protein [Hyphomicrobium sp.]|nr:RibD family protein [Hyphomicrobium sp.]
MSHGVNSTTSGGSDPSTPAEAGSLLAALVNAPRDLPYVIAQLGQSLDGRIATPSGASRWINGASALDHLHRLRANVDAVIVGIGTVAADDPLLTVRRVAGKNPARVVIDPNQRMAATARVLNDDGVRRVIVCKQSASRSDGVEIFAVPATAAGVLNPNAIIATLFKAGFKKILIEGGALTVSSFIDAGAVDRLHLLVAPVILGSGIPGLSLNAIVTLDEARRPQTSVHVLDDGDVLFDCDLKQSL